MVSRTTSLFVALFGFTLGSCVGSLPARGDDIEFFERRIRPLLSEHCYDCHSSRSETVHGGLRLDSAQALTEGGDSGAAVIAGKADESLLLEAVRYEGEIQMPPKGKLSEEQIEWLTQWIAAGAVYPESGDGNVRNQQGIDFDQARQFWSFQPVELQPTPHVSDPDWPQTRIDLFTMAAMDREGLSPSKAADRTTLLRRLSFDLLGVPPTPEQVRAFASDDSPEAFGRIVDQMLQSPKYGEHWGRWWLDLARYTDRTASWLYQTGQAHLYRDWVVRALNDDMPYVEFVKRQLATDLMPQTGPEDLPALGFLSLSPTYWKELKLPSEIIKVIVADEWEERVDAVSRTFLGLTVACARCHDHKFDPITSEDYYALAGIFASCRQVERPLIPEQMYEPVRLAKEEVAKLQAELETLKKQKPPPKAKLSELEGTIAEIKKTTPLYDTPMANALAEESMYVVRAGESPQDGTRLEYRPEPRDLPAFIRGNPNRPGPVVPRRFLTVLTTDPRPYTGGSGRLELAQSITGEAASLAARVLVNRVWLAHFGRGIVSTPSNFGKQGNPPTHPRLLDDLAARFIADGWSLKKLHREIVLSATWQQTSIAKEDLVQADPDNRWLARMNRRRMSYEQWRDAILCCSDDLRNQIGGASIDLEDPGNRRRTIYATVHRRDMSPTLMIHDFPDPTQHSPTRTSTVTALQGLYALNGPLLLQQSEKLAKRIQADSGDRAAERIERAYWLLFSRSPSEREKRIGAEFLGGGVQPIDSDRWQQYLHALLVSNEFVFID